MMGSSAVKSLSERGKAYYCKEGANFILYLSDNIFKNIDIGFFLDIMKCVI